VTRPIRAVAIALIRHEGRLLVFEGKDRMKGRTYFRPLGGGIEPGERAAEAVVRELREEIGAELRGVRQLGVIENLFTLNGEGRHEIVFVMEAELVEPRETYVAREADGEPMTVRWVAIEEFRSGRAWLVPEGLERWLS
jgi:ADP-ribose pyrophosphatase YjhB (NUDIX family)